MPGIILVLGISLEKESKFCFPKADIQAWDRQKKEMDHKTNKLINNIVPNTKSYQRTR